LVVIEVTHKDPAFLLYSSDFLTGVTGMTMEERGQYITLLCLQHQQGHLSEKTCRLSLGLRSLDESPDVKAKFGVDSNGLYYNRRLEQEIIKRAKSSDASRDNGRLGGRPKKPEQNLDVTQQEPIGFKNKTQSEPRNNLSENVNVNEDINIDKDVNEDVNRNGKTTTRAREVQEIVAYLNERVETNFKATSQATQRHIAARFNEGYMLDDFKTVIDKKVAEWQGTEFAKFIRPETLFGSKFEGYLNQPCREPPKSAYNILGEMYREAKAEEEAEERQSPMTEVTGIRAM